MSILDAPVERVFAFHEAPDALALLTPPWETLDIEKPPSSLAVGTEVILVMHLGPARLRWVAEHTVYEKNALFVDRQVSGPFAKWIHRHTFDALGGGKTRLTDDIEWALPFGRLGKLGNPVVRHKLDRTFAYRHAVTRARCEAATVILRQQAETPRGSALCPVLSVAA